MRARKLQRGDYPWLTGTQLAELLTCRACTGTGGEPSRPCPMCQASGLRFPEGPASMRVVDSYYALIAEVERLRKQVA